MRKLAIYDSTLRDGAQGKNISYTILDKIKIVKKLDEMGIDFIEAGNPGSNPKEMEFFKGLRPDMFRHAKIVAFGSTCRVGIDPVEDLNVQNLLKANTEWVAIFGKSWDSQVSRILKTDLSENLSMIQSTVEHLKKQGRKVVYDAEHFFDGYDSNREYAVETLRAALRGGADSICLCDTRGSTFPQDILAVTRRICREFSCEIGIHCHNDNGMGVAGSIAAVEGGARQVQGTFNGTGERCGNANLTTIIPNLQLLKGYRCISPENMVMLRETALFISEVSNLALPDNSPFVGGAAFAHKAGMHADAVHKDTWTYEFIDPGTVGNIREILMSEMAGRSSVMKFIQSIRPNIQKDSPEIHAIMQKLKEMEFEGYQYEGAEASLELIIRKLLGIYKPMFQLVDFKVMVNEPSVNRTNSAAMIKIRVEDVYEITAAEGDGPVNALDSALRKALLRFYPDINGMKLTDYKVRVLDSEMATAAKVRVLIESTDGRKVWTTIGVSTDIIEASWLALVDSIEYSIIAREHK